MRSIQVFGKMVTGWQVLPADAKDFEEAALRACELVLAGDPRIGEGSWSAARLEIGGQAVLGRGVVQRWMRRPIG
jgi:hypothetical protein